jgi:hypothetical protein
MPIFAARFTKKRFSSLSEIAVKNRVLLLQTCERKKIKSREKNLPVIIIALSLQSAKK